MIKPAQFDDLDALVTLLRACAHSGLLRKPEEIHPDMLREKMPQDAKKWLFVARSEGELVGVVWGQIYPLHRLRFTVGDLTLAVLPPFQSQGIGRALMVHLIRAIQEEAPQVHRIELMCNPENQKAVAIYQSLGFVKEGFLRGRFISDDGRFIDDLQMGLIVADNGPVSATRLG